MDRVSQRVCWLVLCMIVTGCGGREYSGNERYPLTGRVTYEDEPVDWGSISFIPTEDKEQRPSGAVIQNGTYEIPEAKGANAGKYRVEIRWGKLTGRQLKAQDSEDMYDERKEALPAKYHTKSELTADVSAGQTEFNFDLKK